MLGLIAAVVATILCAVVYVRMYKREVPEPIGKMKAAIPIGFGIFAVFLTTPLILVGPLLFKKLTGSSIADLVPSPWIRSLVTSFCLAGFSEEFIKFLMFLIVIRIVKPKSVYEYGLLCAGIGVGFTGLEDLLYGLQNPITSVFRLLFFAMHMMFGLLMGVNLGLAKFSKQEGRGDSAKYTVLAMLLPVLWHTLFDASTTANAALYTSDETMQMVGVVVGLIVCVISIVLQVVLLIRFKNKTEEYCSMRLDNGAAKGLHMGDA